MGCLHRFLLQPAAQVQEGLDALLPGGGIEHVGVQVRNRLWKLEALTKKAPAGRPTSGARVLECMDRWVPPHARVFFTADDDSLYALAKARWADRLLLHPGTVYEAWSRGSKVDAATLEDRDEMAVVKAFVDWFALQRSARIVYTHQSSFGKTAAEATDAPNVDVNFTTCASAEDDGLQWSDLPDVGASITYDTSKVPGAR
jgi:hypothetical protein